MSEITVVASNEGSSGSILDADIEDFITRLRADGYAERTVQKKRAVIRAFAEWSRRMKLAVAALSEVHLEKFAGRSRRKQKKRRAFELAVLRPFLQHLRRTAGVEPTVQPNECVPSFKLEQDYVDYLRTERGLADRSVGAYAPHVHSLLLDLSAKHGSATAEGLNAGMIRAFVVDRAQGRSSEWVRLLATALRSFFGFLYYRGETAINLSVNVLTVRKWRQATVPARLSPEEVEGALAVPDQSTAVGGRDYAILLLLARLGVRAGEIVVLELDDIRWRAGEIIIHGKGRRVDHLPLPSDVGEALAHYVRSGRGTCASRRVFLRSQAPKVPLTGPAAIGHIVRKVLARAGIRRKGRGAAHLFRHSLASRMIQNGATISEISEVLRHGSHSATEIYAKVDIRSLREVARDWPGTGGGR